MTAVAVLAPAVVVTETVAEVPPAGTVTVAGTPAVDGAEELSSTTAPPGGAAAARVIVACEVVPPTTDVGARLSEVIEGPAASVSDAVRVKTSWAVMERLPGAAEEVWVMVNVAVV